MTWEAVDFTRLVRDYELARALQDQRSAMENT
ncbi:hypothetical protein M2282_000084 [Variovorax boronicumulans]|nr:hypothetical protein [Variovorax boronicumulans]